MTLSIVQPSTLPIDNAPVRAAMNHVLWLMFTLMPWWAWLAIIAAIAIKILSPPAPRR